MVKFNSGKRPKILHVAAIPPKYHLDILFVDSSLDISEYFVERTGIGFF